MAACGVLRSTPNFHNAAVVGKPCPIDSISSQQSTCCIWSDEEGAQPHLASGTSYSTNVFAVHAELKLRDLEVTLAMHLQQLRGRGFQVAAVDLFSADVASLEGAIQGAQQLLLDCAAPLAGGAAATGSPCGL